MAHAIHDRLHPRLEQEVLTPPEAKLAPLVAQPRAATAGTWRSLGGGTIRNQIDAITPPLPPEIWGSGSPASITIAWNSGAYHPDQHAVYCWGGGHADGAYNGAFKYTFATQTWERFTPHSPGP